MSDAKDSIVQAVDRLGDELEALSRRIHDHPELGYQEKLAAGWLTEFLGAKGLKVERTVGGVETAFRATIETGAGPTIAIMCEYDALPSIGHACGHHAIATAGARAPPPRTAPRGRRRGRGPRRRPRHAAERPHPGHRHARRRRRRRQGEA